MSVYSIKEISDRVRPVAIEYGMGAIYLFGSYARGEANDESDVDLLLDKGKVRGIEFFGLWDDLEEALEKSVDVITTFALYDQYKGIGYYDDLRTSVDKDRRLIYDGKR